MSTESIASKREQGKSERKERLYEAALTLFPCRVTKRPP
jgi:hypothetical protein